MISHRLVMKSLVAALVVAISGCGHAPRPGDTWVLNHDYHIWRVQSDLDQSNVLWSKVSEDEMSKGGPNNSEAIDWELKSKRVYEGSTVKVISVSPDGKRMEVTVLEDAGKDFEKTLKKLGTADDPARRERMARKLVELRDSVVGKTGWM